MQEQQSELEILFPQGIDVNLKNEVINIKPFKLGQLPAVMKVMQKVANPIQQSMLTNVSQDANFLLSLIADFGDELIKLIALIIKKPIEFVEDLDQDETVILLKSIIEVNKDFFSKRVTPLIQQMKK